MNHRSTSFFSFQHWKSMVSKHLKNHLELILLPIIEVLDNLPNIIVFCIIYFIYLFIFIFKTKEEHKD